ncbi:hypothetical protein QR680_002892 [Steinernema hermaphroditum]|uniref:Uncharacterized protein n=1 Tax=Steinernema hermaphroditum TaxID=289476 RepID=A0AA39H4H3_9BILA|nr:hypothetical protein QR680_002892 [Steinernema hermaphroditum]
MVPLSGSLDTLLILARSATECRTYFDLLEGRDTFDSTTVDSHRCIENVKSSLNGVVIEMPQLRSTLTICCLLCDRSSCCDR